MSEVITINPTEEDMKIDLACLLPLCDAASPGPWDRIEGVGLTHEPCPIYCCHGNDFPRLYAYSSNKEADIRFAMAARIALAPAIRRALAAEHELVGLRKAYDLLNKWFESACEHMDLIKQKVRSSEAIKDNSHV